MFEPSPISYQHIMNIFDEGYNALWLMTLIVLLAVLAWSKLLRLELTRDRKTFTEHPSKGVWAALYITAVVVRLPLLIRSLWYDEAFTAAMTQAPDFMTALFADVHPPGHYLITKVFTLVLGENEIALRLPSLIAGLLIIYVVYRVAWLLTRDTLTAFIAAGLITVLPAMIHYSAEARYPMMLALAVMCALWAYLEGRWGWYALALGCIPMFHATGLVYSAILFGFTLLDIPNNELPKFSVATGFWMLAALLMVAQSIDVSNGFWLPARSPLWHIVDMSIYPSGDTGLATLVMLMTIIAITPVALWLARRWIVANGRILIPVMIVPLFMGLISLLWHPVYLQRALIASTIPIIICWAWALPRLPMAVSGVFWLAIALSLGSYANDYLTPHAIDLRTVYTHCENSDFTYATSTHMAVNAMFYAPSPLRVWRYGDSLAQDLTDEAKQAIGMALVGEQWSLPRGEGCLIAMYEPNMLTNERAHIASLFLTEQILSDEWIDVNFITRYRIVRFYHE
jgi:hypothetical protein